MSKDQLERVSGYLDIGQKEGAKALAGGSRLTEGALSKGYFVPPTVFANVQDNMRIAQEEIFGPVISAISFKDSDELIKRANATTFGLGSGVWTTNVSKAHQVAKALRAGSVWVNCYQAMDPAVPFGGYKMSGYGREVRQAARRRVSQRQGGLDQDRLRYRPIGGSWRWRPRPPSSF